MMRDRIPQKVKNQTTTKIVGHCGNNSDGATTITTLRNTHTSSPQQCHNDITTMMHYDPSFQQKQERNFYYPNIVLLKQNISSFTPFYPDKKNDYVKYKENEMFEAFELLLQTKLPKQQNAYNCQNILMT